MADAILDSATPKPVLARKEESSLVIEVLQPARLVVSVDGNIKFRGLAPVGARQTWLAKREFILWTNSPSALKVSLDGRLYPLSHPDIKGNYHIKAMTILAQKGALAHKKKKKRALKPLTKPNPDAKAKPVISPVVLSTNPASSPSGAVR